MHADPWSKKLSCWKTRVNRSVKKLRTSLVGCKLFNLARNWALLQAAVNEQCNETAGHKVRRNFLTELTVRSHVVNELLGS
jgi:hypothetical protein